MKRVITASAVLAVSATLLTTLPENGAAPGPRQAQDDSTGAAPKPAQAPERLSAPVPSLPDHEIAQAFPGNRLVFPGVHPSVAQKVHAVIDQSTDEILPDGRIERRYLLDTDFHYPRIRVVDTHERNPDGSAGRLLERVAMVADHVVVAVDTPELTGRLRAAGFNLRATFPHSPIVLVEATADSVDSLPAAIDDLRRQIGALRVAEPDYIVYPMLESLSEPEEVEAFTSGETNSILPLNSPNDVSFASGALYGLHNTGQSGGVADADVDAPEGWAIRTSASNIVVGVLDTGVRSSHVDLTDNMWRNPGESGGGKETNGVDDDGNGYVDDVFGINSVTNSAASGDNNGHGTHCAGTIGASGNNSIGITGVAWSVKIMDLKFLNPSGAVSDAIECLDYARTMGATLTSNSWGGGAFSSALVDAINRQRTSGMIFIAASGNSNLNSDSSAAYPASYDNDNVVAVASHDRTGARSSFSNYGLRTSDLAAPGSDIYSTYYRSNTDYTSLSGTSMATPHVSGIVALLEAEFPSENYLAIINRLLAGTESAPAFRGITSTGRRANLHRALSLPTITSPPSAASVAVGGSTTLSVTASGGTLTYQWMRDGIDIPGATSDSLSIASASHSDEGFYSVRVSNSVGGIVSPMVQLAVTSANQWRVILTPDLNGDGRADAVWRNSGTGQVVARLMNGTTAGTAVTLLSNADWVPVATGDFNADGRGDLVLRNRTSGGINLWLMNGTAVSSGGVITTNLQWHPTLVADLNGDGRSDLVLRNPSTNSASIHLMSGTGNLGGSHPLDGSLWQVTHAVDSNGDRRADLVLRNRSTNGTALWLMNGGSITGGGTLFANSNWYPIAVGEFNGDGRGDIVLRNDATNSTTLWFMNGTAVGGGGSLLNGSNWNPNLTGDFNGDGRSDIVLRNASTNSVAIWVMNGLSVAGGGTLLTNSSWIPSAFADFNGDRRNDILLRHASTGNTTLWLMNGTTVTSGAGITAQ